MELYLGMEYNKAGAVVYTGLKKFKVMKYY